MLSHLGFLPVLYRLSTMVLEDCVWALRRLVTQVQSMGFSVIPF